MKIVQIEDVFHPAAGYQINIISKYFALKNQVTIITAQLDRVPEGFTSFFGKENVEEQDRKYEKQYGVKILRLPLKGFISGRAVFGKELFEAIRKEKPDVLYVHGNDTLTAIRCLWRYKKLEIPMVTDSHMLAMASKNRFNQRFRKFYKCMITPILLKNHIPVIRTQDDPYVEQYLGIPLKQAPWISVGSDTMLFHPDLEGRKKFREEHHIPEDAFVVLYAGKLDESKGGLLLAKAIQKKFATNRNVIFMIVGKTVGDYGEQVESLLSKSENTILRFPTQKYSELPRFYQASDLAVFPRQCSLSFYDVQACGLPVVFEDNNINLDRSCADNALVFRSEDAEDFRGKIEQMINLSAEQYQRISENAKHYVNEGYDYAKLFQRYLEILQSAVQMQKFAKEK